MSRLLPIVRLLVLACLSGVLGPASAQNTKSDEKPPHLKAEELAREYRTDPDAFDRQHKGKKLRITGVVQDTILAKSGIISLRGFLDAKEAPTHIQAYLTSAEKGSAASFKTNQAVTVEGLYPGAGSKFVFVLENCSVVK